MILTILHKKYILFLYNIQWLLSFLYCFCFYKNNNNIINSNFNYYSSIFEDKCFCFFFLKKIYLYINIILIYNKYIIKNNNIYIYI